MGRNGYTTERNKNPGRGQSSIEGRDQLRFPRAAKPNRKGLLMWYNELNVTWFNITELRKSGFAAGALSCFCEVVIVTCCWGVDDIGSIGSASTGMGGGGMEGGWGMGTATAWSCCCCEEARSWKQRRPVSEGGAKFRPRGSSQSEKASKVTVNDAHDAIYVQAVCIPYG